MKLVAGIVGNTKKVEIYCERSIRLKENSLINLEPGAYIIDLFVPVLVVVQNKMPL
jgi:hypothetical protein